MYQPKDIASQIQTAFSDLCIPCSRLWVAPNIPDDKIQKATSHFLFLKDDERLLGLGDETFLGGGQDGYALTTQRIYWKNQSQNASVVRYIDLKHSAQVTGGIFSPRLELDTNKAIALHLTDSNSRTSLAEFVNTVRQLLAQPELAQLENRPAVTTPAIDALGDRIQSQNKSKRHDPLVDINNATLVDLLLLPAISKTSAERLVEERVLRMGFDSVEEIGDLLHLEPHQVQRLKERVEIKPLLGTKPASSTRRRVVEF